VSPASRRLIPFWTVRQVRFLEQGLASFPDFETQYSFPDAMLDWLDAELATLVELLLDLAIELELEDDELVLDAIELELGEIEIDDELLDWELERVELSMDELLAPAILDWLEAEIATLVGLLDLAIELELIELDELIEFTLELMLD
jgi:hypothetical protein